MSALAYEEFESKIGQLAARIISDGYIPDIIVGITRGGVVPARYLSGCLGVKEMHGISVEKIGEEREVTTEIKKGLRDKKILLVEDALETGESLVVAKSYLESKGATVKTACLYRWPDSAVPDYCLEEVSEIPKFP